MKSNSTNRPSTLESIGKGKWHYNYHIEEVEATEERAASFDYDCVEIQGTPTYDKCVTAVIRAIYPADAEMALVNKYNSYQQGVSDDASVVEEYAGYLRFVADTKAMVRKDLNVQEGQKPTVSSPRMNDLMRLLAMRINTMQLTESEALTVKSLYPEWKAGIDVKTGERYNSDGSLWEVVQNHTTQDNWKPSQYTLSLWKKVDSEGHSGTQDDPIPYEQGMSLEKGKYYSQFGVTYECIQASGPLVYDLYQVPAIAKAVEN